MMKRKTGFTIIETLISMALMLILVGAIILAYRSCFHAFEAGQSRAKAREQLTQTMDLIIREGQNAQGVTQCNENSLTFWLSSGRVTYYLYNSNDAGPYTLPHTYTQTSYNLLRYEGVYPATTPPFGWGTVKLAGLKPPGSGIASVFSCTHSLVSLNMTSVQNGATVTLQSSVMPKNMPAGSLGLVGWWSFNDVFPTVTGSCSTVLDYSGNGNIGTCSGSPGWTTGQVSTVGALSFSSGSSQYVGLGNPASLQLNAPLTIAAWFKLASSVDSNTYVSIIGHGDGGWVLGINNNKLYGSKSGQAPYITGTTTLSTGTWYHAVLTALGSNGVLYLNGVSDGTSSSSPTWTFARSLRIASDDYSGGASYLSATIDDVRIYSRVLSAAEIYELYHEGLGT
ncbi:MAG: prepilin-type N-terminal cleavage/methylation domain-containing protein [Candidatus Omnitrophica bacterium]|nr:prepilin-type N-terminal cleavage/methylation domain-containing protein [Candidatus Omnitrophota bacterium]